MHVTELFFKNVGCAVLLYGAFRQRTQPAGHGADVDEPRSRFMEEQDVALFPPADISIPIVCAQPEERHGGILKLKRRSQNRLWLHHGGVAAVCENCVVVGPGRVVVVTQCIGDALVLVATREVVVHDGTIRHVELPRVVEAVLKPFCDRHTGLK